MKIYYAVDDLYPASETFYNETVGTTGTSIDFIDTETSDDSTYSVTVTESYLGHKAILKFLASGDNGAVSHWEHDCSDETDGIFELWILYTDKGDHGSFSFIGIDDSANEIWELKFTNADNKIYGYYGDGVGGTTSTNQACSAGVWHHIRMEFDMSNDRIDCWVDGAKFIDDQNFMNDTASVNIDKISFYLEGAGGNNSLEAYIDAVGWDWDTDYALGDNERDIYHDTYNKEEMANIMEYPTISIEMNMLSIISFEGLDVEGSLYSTWHDRDFWKFVVEDDDDNVIWRGYLISRSFTAYSMQVKCGSFAHTLKWKTFNNNYEYETGYFQNAPSTETITCYHDENDNETYDAGGSEDFNWSTSPDVWSHAGAMNGLVIAAPTGIQDYEWRASSVSYDQADASAGNAANTTAYNDSSYSVTINSVRPIRCSCYFSIC